MPQKIQMLVVAAYPPELKNFVRLGRRHFVVKKDTAFLAAGIGPVAAAFGLTHFLEDYRPEKIIAVGTAGILNSKKYSVGDVVYVKSVATDSGMSDSYTPKLQKSEIRLVQKNAKAARVYSPQEITSTDARRQVLALRGHDIENLEAFAFAFVAKKFRIPIKIVLGLTNQAGPNAHSQWQANEKSCLKKVQKIIGNL